jgi:uroporphyrin-III C-methyltransferase
LGYFYVIIRILDINTIQFYVLLRNFLLFLSMKPEDSRVILIGAGPGDPDLLTIKGDRMLRKADVVLYDALVVTEMLSRCRATAKLVYVGKRKGNAAMSQEEINHLLLWHARRHCLVVRLKGGDPLVFGRGHEEVAFLAGHGIKTEIIPGISSALAAPALAGISITQRGINESFWVVTGTLSDGALSKDIVHAAQSTATLIVLMGMGKLGEIASLVSALRSPFEPMAIIEQASGQAQRQVYSTAQNIVADALSHGLGTPAVIVVGNVVDNIMPGFVSGTLNSHQTSGIPHV